MVDELATTEDPLVTLMRRTEVHPDASESIAAYYDLNVLMEEFRRHRYDARGKLERLFGMLDSGDVKVAQWAMKQLDGILRSALKMRGLWVQPAGRLPAGATDPLGQVQVPVPVQSLEMTMRSVRVTMQHLQETPDGEAAPAEIFDSPARTALSAGADTGTGEDDFYRDDRADNPNIHRPPTRPLGGIT